MGYNTFIQHRTTMIDLSKFVNKKVCVTFRDDDKETGVIVKILGDHRYYPFIFRTEKFDTVYTKGGKINLNCSSYGDIIDIEELNETNGRRN